MAELSSAELSAIEAVNPAIQAVGFATKMRAIQNPTISTYAVDGAIAFTAPYNIAKLTKGTAGAYTLAAPTTAQEGYRLLILCGSAAAHVVTATD